MSIVISQFVCKQIVNARAAKRSYDRLAIVSIATQVGVKPHFLVYLNRVAIIVGTRRRIIAFLNGILQRAVAIHIAVGAIKVRNGTTENSFLHRFFPLFQIM
jgi:hypothetical protein